MNGPQVTEWVAKAEEDYRAAMALDACDLPSVVCFHSQQCIEKYLKAALLVHGESPPRVHDLIALVEAVAERDPRFSALSEALEALAPYSVLVRYPGLTVSVEDARKAQEATQELRARIRQLLGLRLEG